MKNENCVFAPGLKVFKGQDPEIDSYSALFDNASLNATELPRILEEVGATQVFMCGLAYDVCVCSSCLDGLQIGYPVALVDNCCSAVDTGAIDEVRRKIDKLGGVVLQADKVKDFVCGEKRSIIMALKRAKKSCETKR